jgi:phage baseplate assembly protein W
MSNGTLHPSITLGSLRPWMDPEAALSTKIRMILETRPGQVPWRPDFGCDLRGLVGRQANDETLVKARYAVQTALSRWLPDVDVNSVNVNLVRNAQSADQFRQPEIPIGERALVGSGPLAAVRIDVELDTPDGLMTVSAVVD